MSLHRASSLLSNPTAYENVETDPIPAGTTEGGVSTVFKDHQPPNNPTRSSSSESGLEAEFSQSTTTVPPESASRRRNHRQLSLSPVVPTASSANGPDDQAGASSTKKGGEHVVVTWSSLPRKGQLTVLTLARLAEPLTQTSLQSYLYYQLESFDPTQAPSQITAQAGVVVAAFAAAQAVTAVLWGRVADSIWGGRKFVIIVGLCGTGLGSLGYGFAGDWRAAVAWRLVAGSLNGNVGVMRTMISEIVKEKKYQSRAFLLLPMCFNVGVIIGPLLGGLLADPVGSYPGLFGPGTLLGGADGVWWMRNWPYSLPNIVSSVYLTSAAFMVWLCLEETHEVLRERPDYGIRLGRLIKRSALRLIGRRPGYSQIPGDDIDAEGDPSLLTPATPLTPLTPHGPGAASDRIVKHKLPFRRLWTRNVVCTMLSHFTMAMGVGTFNALWFLFLSTPRWDPAHPHPPTLTEPQLPLRFSGGLGLPPPRIGAAMAVLGVIGITMQLALYPRVAARLGTLRALQASVLLFPLVYLAVPYLALVPSTGPPPPAAAAGPAVWAALSAVLAVQVLARTFALPAAAILINNSSPHPSVLGTIHGIAQSASSAARTLGPVGAGWVFGRGLELGVVGLAFWIMAAVGVVEVALSRLLREGDGHEIWLEGEKEELEAREHTAARLANETGGR